MDNNTTKAESFTRALAKGEDERSSSPTRALAKGEDERSSSPTRALAKGEDERSSSPTRAAAKGGKEDLSSSTNSQEHQQKADKKPITELPFIEAKVKKRTKFSSPKISVKTIILIVVIIALGVLAYIYKGLFIAVTVNGSPISRLSIIQKLEKASGKNLLDSLIIEKLVQNEVSAKKIVVSNDEINGEIKKIEDQVIAQGSTLEAALSAQGMSMDDLKKQIIFQKKVEKLVADKINVTDEEVAQYIKDNAISIPEGQEATATAQIKNELRNQKLNKEADALITTLKSQAKIRYFVNY